MADAGVRSLPKQEKGIASRQEGSKVAQARGLLDEYGMSCLERNTESTDIHP